MEEEKLLDDDGTVLEELLICCPCLWEEALCRDSATIWPQGNSCDQCLGCTGETGKTESTGSQGIVIKGSELHCAGRVMERRYKCSQSDKHEKPSQTP